MTRETDTVLPMDMTLLRGVEDRFRREWDKGVRATARSHIFKVRKRIMDGEHSMALAPLSSALAAMGLVIEKIGHKPCGEADAVRKLRQLPSALAHFGEDAVREAWDMLYAAHHATSILVTMRVAWRQFPDTTPTPAAVETAEDIATKSSVGLDTAVQETLRVLDEMARKPSIQEETV